MPFPPENTKPQDLWTTICSLPRPYRVVDFPRRFPEIDPATGEKHPKAGEPVGQVAIWVLTEGDLTLCQTAAQEYATAVLKKPPKADEQNIAYSTLFANAASVEIVCRACRKPENLKEPAFPSPKMVRSTLTADEISVLMRMYSEIQLECGPIVSHMTEEEMDAWLEVLGKGGQQTPFFLLSLDQLRDLLKHSAYRLRSLRTDMSSRGLPPSDGTLPNETPAMPSDEFASMDAAPPDDEFAGK